MAAFRDLLTSIYLNSPINFSLLTGWRYPQLPRLKGHFLLGRLPHLFEDEGILNNLMAAKELAVKHESGMSYYWIANKMVLLVTKPHQVRQLLVENDANISRESAYKVFKLFIGSNITVDPRPLWKKKKEIYSDWLFKPDSLKHHAPKMSEVANKYIEYLKTNPTVNLQEFFPRFTLDVLLTATICPHAANPHTLNQLIDYQENNLGKLFKFKSLFKWLMPTLLQQLFFPKQLKESHSIKKKIRTDLNNILLKPNETELKTTNNFVHSIYQLTPHQPEDELINDPSVFGDTNMLLVSGQETSVTTFTFAIKLLQAHPEIEKKLRHELQTKLKDKPLTIENVNEVEYLELVLKETLRLYPPVPFLPRDVVRPFKIDNVALKKGDIVLFAPLVTHYLDSVWHEPTEFKPERFLEEKNLPHQAYIPFGAGSTMCIGQRFAWQELKLLLSAIYLNFHVDIANNDFELTLAEGSLKPKLPTLAQFIPV